MGIQIQPCCCSDPLWGAPFDQYFYRLNRTGRRAKKQWRVQTADTGGGAIAAYIDVVFHEATKQPYLYGLTQDRGIMLIDGKTGEVLARQPEVRGPESPDNVQVGIFNPPTARTKHNAVAWIEHTGPIMSEPKGALRLYKTDLAFDGSPSLVVVCQGADTLTGDDYLAVNWASWVMDYEEPYIYYSIPQVDVFDAMPNPIPKGEYSYVRRVSLDGTSDTLLLDGHSGELARRIYNMEVDRDHDVLYLVELAQLPNNTASPWFTLRPQRISTIPITGGTTTPIVELTETTDSRIRSIRYNPKDQKLYYSRTGSPLDQTVHGIRRCNYDGSEDELFMSYRDIRFLSNSPATTFSAFTQFHFGPHLSGNDYRS